MKANAEPAKLTVAKTAGFCFGVSRAIAMTREHAAGAYAIGQVIHNAAVIAELEALGMRTVSSADEIPAGATAIIRAHGECRSVYDALAAKGVRVVDLVEGGVIGLALANAVGQDNVGSVGKHQQGLGAPAPGNVRTGNGYGQLTGIGDIVHRDV